MSAQSRFFPSIYDNSNTSTDIWSTLMQNHENLIPQLPQHQQPRQTAPEVTELWPDTGILAVPEYQPLQVFSPGADGPSVRWSEVDDICELDIRLKEIELGTMMGDSFDTIRYAFLSNVHYDKVQQLRRRK